MMPGQRESEILDGRAAVGEKPPPERRIHPGPGHDSGAILRDPLLPGQVLQLRDGVVIDRQALLP